MSDFESVYRIIGKDETAPTFASVQTKLNELGKTVSSGPIKDGFRSLANQFAGIADSAAGKAIDGLATAMASGSIAVGGLTAALGLVNAAYEYHKKQVAGVKAAKEAEAESVRATRETYERLGEAVAAVGRAYTLDTKIERTKTLVNEAANAVRFHTQEIEKYQKVLRNVESTEAQRKQAQAQIASNEGALRVAKAQEAQEAGRARGLDLAQIRRAIDDAINPKEGVDRDLADMKAKYLRLFEQLKEAGGVNIPGLRDELARAQAIEQYGILEAERVKEKEKELAQLNKAADAEIKRNEILKKTAETMNEITDAITRQRAEGADLKTVAAFRQQAADARRNAGPLGLGDAAVKEADRKVELAEREAEARRDVARLTQTYAGQIKRIREELDDTTKDIPDADRQRMEELIARLEDDRDAAVRRVAETEARVRRELRQGDFARDDAEQARAKLAGLEREAAQPRATPVLTGLADLVKSTQLAGLNQSDPLKRQIEQQKLIVDRLDKQVEKADQIIKALDANRRDAAIVNFNG